VARLYLELCELSGFVGGQEREKSFKFIRRFLRVARLCNQQMFKLPDCFIVVHIRFHPSNQIGRDGEIRLQGLPPIQLADGIGYTLVSGDTWTVQCTDRIHPINTLVAVDTFVQ
jgi:hypothetical protein